MWKILLLLLLVGLVTALDYQNEKEDTTSKGRRELFGRRSWNVWKTCSKRYGPKRGKCPKARCISLKWGCPRGQTRVSLPTEYRPSKYGACCPKMCNSKCTKWRKKPHAWRSVVRGRRALDDQNELERQLMEDSADEPEEDEDEEEVAVKLKDFFVKPNKIDFGKVKRQFKKLGGQIKKGWNKVFGGRRRRRFRRQLMEDSADEPEEDEDEEEVAVKLKEELQEDSEEFEVAEQEFASAKPNFFSDGRPKFLEFGILENALDQQFEFSEEELADFLDNGSEN